MLPETAAHQVTLFRQKEVGTGSETHNQALKMFLLVLGKHKGIKLTQVDKLLCIKILVTTQEHQTTELYMPSGTDCKTSTTLRLLIKAIHESLGLLCNHHRRSSCRYLRSQVA